MALKGNDAYKVVCKQEGTDIITSVSCTPAELLGIIQNLVDTFADAAGISYNDVLMDLIELEATQERGE